MSSMSPINTQKVILKMNNINNIHYIYRGINPSGIESSRIPYDPAIAKYNPNRLYESRTTGGGLMIWEQLLINECKKKRKELNNGR